MHHSGSGWLARPSPWGTCTSYSLPAFLAHSPKGQGLPPGRCWHHDRCTPGRALHLTQGAVSQQIKRLEAFFGASLFTRDRRGLRLTPSGERLLSKARRMTRLNDEIWAEMTGRAVEGKVRLGVPQDLVGECLAPVLKTYSETFPQVEISLVCAASTELVEAMAGGAIDLALIEEPVGRSAGECVRVERLVWVGAKGGEAHRKSPTPISLVAESCVFRPAVLGALDELGRAWRAAFDNGGVEATIATVRADLAVTAWLASVVPDGLDILSSADGLPDLPPFSINLHLTERDLAPAATALARHIRAELAQPLLRADRLLRG